MTFTKKDQLPNTPYVKLLGLKAKLDRLSNHKASIEKEWIATAKEAAELLKQLEKDAA